MTECNCIDCMYGGNIGKEHGGIAPPSNEKGDGEMIGFDLNGEGASWKAVQSWQQGWLNNSIRLNIKLSYSAYVVKSDKKERYAKTKEKALQFASEMLGCDGKVEIKRIELS